MTDQKTLNNEQHAAVTHGQGPLLIIAGAGTGKTTVVTERIKHIILEEKVAPENILALTFTEKAAKEMEERVDIALPYGYTRLWIATFHGFCDQILRDNGIHIGLTPGYTLATETEAILFLQKHLFDLKLSYFRPLGNPTKFLQGMVQHFSRLKDEDISPEQYLSWAKKREHDASSEEEKEEAAKYLELANAYILYQELKEKTGILDFGDLITYTLQLFRARKHILKQYQEKFHYFLIDEFQDTNYAQNQLALLLAGTKQNITVVGDDDQAIYRWRGAAISNMIDFRKAYPKAKVITLTKNYRSTGNILDSAYRLIQFNNPDRLEIKEKIDKKLVPMRKTEGKPVEMILADRGEHEADAVVRKIQEIVQKKKYHYKDFAILVRANDHSQPFVRAFEYARLPYQFLGPGQLFHQEEIKDLIAYLKVLYNFEDSSALYRVLTMPIFTLSGTDIATLLQYAKKKNISLFAALNKTKEIELSEKGKETIEKIQKMLASHLSSVAKESAGKILYLFLEESGLLQKYLNVSSAQEEIEAQNVTRFFERLKGFESQREDASVFAVTDWIELSMQLGESPLAANSDWTENDAINILTVHSSKGLEFPVVFVTNLVTQRFPTRERKEQIPIPEELIQEILPEGDFHTQEERRLFYVAMTRARDLLFLTAANFYGEGKRERKLSPFVAESIGADTVELAKNAKVMQESQLTLLDLFPKKAVAVSDLQQLPKQKITYISYSQMQTFDLCPLHYKLRYILKIPTEESAAQKFGTIIHCVLRDFYMSYVQDTPVPLENVEEILKHHWSPDGFDGKDHEKEGYKKALTVLTKYLKHDFNKNNLPIALEVPFQFFASPKLKVGGRIDRIDRLDSKRLEIIDYKTGSTLPSEKDLAKNFQLTLYGLAATEIRDPLLHRQPEEIVLSLVYLEEGKKFSTTRTREQLEAAKTEIVAKVKEIEASDFACSGSIFCQNCEYKMLCKTKN